jgi:hypothetical protein
LVFKVAYTFDAAGELSPLPQPTIEETDRYRGDPETSSLIAAGEIAPFKQGSELLLYGSAHPSGPSESVLQVQVSLRQRNNHFWSKELRVFGRRSWNRKLFTVIPGAPAIIEEPVPLVFENAYGGTDPRNPEEFFPANPAGVGFSLRGFRTKGLTLPQIECGLNFISSPASRVKPAGFGPLAPHWEPRCQESADMDTESLAFGGCPWSKEPSETLYNSAPLDQRFDQPFSGEMSLQLKGLAADQSEDILIHLPEVKPRIQMELKGKISELQTLCDTLVVKADEMQIYLICRCALPWSQNLNEEGLVILRDLVAEEQARIEQAEATA